MLINFERKRSLDEDSDDEVVAPPPKKTKRKLAKIQDSSVTNLQNKFSLVYVFCLFKKALSLSKLTNVYRIYQVSFLRPFLKG